MRTDQDQVVTLQPLKTPRRNPLAGDTDTVVISQTESMPSPASRPTKPPTHRVPTMRSEPLLILIWLLFLGGPPNHCRITGTPSLGEVPSVGARAFWLLWGFSKVTRCKSRTHSSRNLNNGYVPGLIQHPGRLSGRLRGQARSHIWIVALPVDCGRLSGRFRGRARSHSCIGG